MPENWKTYKLSQLASLITKGTTPSTYGFDFVDSGITYIRAQSLNYDGRIDEEAFSYISPDAHKKLKRSQLEPGDILFSMAGAYLGMVGMVKESYCPANTNQAVGIIRINNASVSSKFIEYTLRSPSMISYVNSQSGQSAQPNINLTEIGNLVISAPSLEEQRAIASILSALDDKIELNLQMNKTLEEMAMALYKHWFVDFGPFQNGKFVESELRLIPEGWEVVSIYKLIDVIYGAPFKSKLFNEDKEGYPLIRIRDLKSGKPQYFTEENHVNKTIIKKGDILAGMDALFAPYSWSGEEGVMNQRVVYFKPRIESVKRRYIYEAVKPWLRFYEGAKVGTTVIHLSKSDIDNFKLVYPKNHDTIKEVNDEIDALHELIISNDTEIATLTTLRDTLLPKLISGEIRVKDAEQRIAASL
jgi:type I restriction enzyme S subunit